MSNIIAFTIEKKKHKYIGGDVMCKALERVKEKKTPEELLESYNLENEAPVDIEKLLKALGISAMGTDFSKLEKLLNKPENSILGAMISSGENAAIFYRKSDSYNRKRFTIAHELAHIMLHSGTEPHIEYRTDNEDINKRPTEIEANIKSGELLIPFNLLKKEYLKLEIPSSITLSKIFEVSVNVMEARLNKLGVSYFNGNGEAITYGDR